MSSWLGESTREPAPAGRDDRAAPGSSLDNDLHDRAGLNPSLASAFAALSSFEADGRDARAAEAAVDTGRRAALLRAAARLDDTLAILADARRSLDAGDPGEAVALAEAECRRLASDLAFYRPSLVTDADGSSDELPGRGAFDRVVARLAAVVPGDRPSSLMLVGVDRLSRLDAAHGDGASADVLAAVGRAMTTSFAGVGEVFRFDLDVFAAVLPGAPLRQAVAVAEHLRRSLASRRLVRRSTGDELGRITLSAGVVSASGGAEGPDAVERAIRCLGEAHWYGGDRVVCETDPAFEQSLRAIA